MAKAMNLGVASRFALLKIDDDDEDEENAHGLPSSQNKKPGQGKTKFVPFSTAAGAGSQKQKKKSVKKRKPVEFGDSSKEIEESHSGDEEMKEALRISQMTAAEEQLRRRELEAEEEEGTKRAIEESAKNQSIRNEGAPAKLQSKPYDTKKGVTGAASPPPRRTIGDKEENRDDEEKNGSDNSEIESLIRLTMDEAIQLVGSSKRQRPASESTENALSELYKRKFEQVASLAKEQQQEIKTLKNDLVKAKSRAKRVLEVMAEAETREKAELIIGRDKVAKLNDELMQQIADMHTELEQARSRIHELENEQKKAKSTR